MRDKGLQPERTALAWSRTLLALCACLMLLLRSAWLSSNGEHGMLWSVYVLAICAIPMAVVTLSRAKYLKHATKPKQITPVIPFALSMACMLSAALAVWSKLS